MTRYFYDTEFIEDGVTIDLVSIGVVCEDGREFYAVSTEHDPSRAIRWVADNVLAHLPPPSDPAWMSRQQIREQLLDFLLAGDSEPQLWAWVAAYDHVVLCQLWGAMPALPGPLPRYTRELKQLWEQLGRPKLPSLRGTAHVSLDDARHAATRFAALHERAFSLGLDL